MSAQRSATKTEKAKQLRDVRHRLQWTQQQMAEALGLDASYLSQLENGRRKLDDWYLKKAGEFEKSNTTNVLGAATAESMSMQTAADSCIEYLTRFLATCKDPEKIVWTQVELQHRFPLDKWSVKAEISSKRPSITAETVARPGTAYDRDRQKPESTR